MALSNKYDLVAGWGSPEDQQHSHRLFKHNSITPFPILALDNLFQSFNLALTMNFTIPRDKGPKLYEFSERIPISDDSKEASLLSNDSVLETPLPLHRTLGSAASSLPDSPEERAVTRARRSVRFPKALVDGYVPPVFDILTTELASEIWYQPFEVAVMKSLTRKLVIYGKQDDHDDLSGLERFNLERSQHKRQTIQCVLLASQRRKQQEQNTIDITSKRQQIRSSTVDFLRLISKQCTAISTDVALVQGFNDFCQAYDPLQSLLGTNDGNYNDILFNEKKLQDQRLSEMHVDPDKIYPNKRKACQVQDSFSEALVAGSSLQDHRQVRRRILQKECTSLEAL